MAVLSALRRTPGALLRNPILFVPVAVLMLFQMPQLAIQAVDPLLASAVSVAISLLFIVVMPFFQGGIVGMADEALQTPTSLETFVEEGKSNYVAVLIGYVFLVAANVVVGIVAFLGALLVGIAVFAGGAGGPSLVILAIAGIVGLLLLLAYLLFVFFVQFYAPAIVIDDMSAVEGIKHSASVVRANLVSTLGYTLIVGLLGGAIGLVFGLASMLFSPGSPAIDVGPDLSLVGVVVIALVIAVIGSLFGGFFGVYQVAFYREVTR